MYRYKKSTRDLLIGVLTILFLAWIIRAIKNWSRKRKQLLNLAAKLPGPKPLPIIGNALQFACKPEELLDRIVEAIMPYKDVTPMRFWLGPMLLVVVTEPRDIEVILNSRKATHRGSIYQLLQPFLGDGLISGSGHTWRAHRKLVAPMLNGQTIEGYMDIIQKHFQTLVTKLEPLANGIEFDIGLYLGRCTMDAICDSIMGCGDINTQEYPDHQFTHATERLYEIVHNRILKVWLHPEFIFRLSSYYQEHQKCRRIVHGFMEKLIHAKKQEFAASMKGKADGSVERNSILEKIIEKMKLDQEIINDEQLRDEILTIYLASQDTIASIGGFALLMLGMHKDIQEKVRNELTQVWTTGNSVIGLLPDLKYLEMVIKETLRLFPIAPFLVRRLQSDLTLDSCVLPEGCEVAIASYTIQRSPRHWETPEKFRPERFEATEVAKRHPYAYIPFSSGPMGCIGQKFAMMSMKMIVAHVIKSYKIDTTMRMEDIKLKSDISVRCINGFKLSLEPLKL